MRPNWTDYFMGLAFAISQRSLDGQTKHGAIIVDSHNHIIGTGYNNFPRKMRDENLPRFRPEKYKWMIHAEENALSNCTLNLWTIPGGATIYVTGLPCERCSKLLWQNNISRWYIAKRRGTMLESAETQRDLDQLIKETGIELNYVDINIDWLRNMSFEDVA